MMKRSLCSIGVLALVFFSGDAVIAQAPRGLSNAPEEFEAKLGYQTGTISLRGGME